MVEVRRKDRKSYAPQSLYQICCGLLRYVRELKPKVNFFTDVEFRGFQTDVEMKWLRGEGVGVTWKRAEPIFVKEERELW